mgnify:CR=1 FL=1
MPPKTVPTHMIKKCIVFSQNQVVVHNDDQDIFNLPQWQMLQDHPELSAYQDQIVTIAVAPDYHVNMIDLRQAIGFPPSRVEAQEQNLIITEYNRTIQGFLVGQVRLTFRKSED